MPGRLGPRFALEAGFLIVLAVAMGLADLDATAIVVVMAIAWLLVALVEWIASREPRYPVGSAWPAAPPAQAPAPPEWGPPEEATEFIAPILEDGDTPAPFAAPVAAEEPAPAEPVAEEPRRRRGWRRRTP
jgi:hypothetical protein